MRLFARESALRKGKPEPDRLAESGARALFHISLCLHVYGQPGNPARQETTEILIFVIVHRASATTECGFVGGVNGTHDLATSGQSSRRRHQIEREKEITNATVSSVVN